MAILLTFYFTNANSAMRLKANDGGEWLGFYWQTSELPDTAHKGHDELTWTLQNSL